MSMKLSIRNKWVKALRSGKYAQTSSCLKRHGGGYCCLGVLVDIYRKDNKVTFKQATLIKKRGKGIPRNTYNTGTLTQKVIDWAGLDSHNPEVKCSLGLSSGLKTVSLSVLNDVEHMNFEGIANIIECNL